MDNRIGATRYNQILMLRHVIETQQFDRDLLKDVFARATKLEKKRNGTLQGKILATLFYEPSTRTRFSFESAMLRLGGGILSAENANETSSSLKGETLEDTIRILDQFSDAIVLRHPLMGSAMRAAAVSRVPIINGGDGAGQHPTQALLDLYTIEREIGQINGVHVALVGDLKYGRAPRSLAYLFGKYRNVRLTLVSPRALRMHDEIRVYLRRYKVPFEEVESLETVMRTADVVYQTRIQKERFKNQVEYKKFKGRYVIDRDMADSMKRNSIIIHPLPRVGEITPDVDDSPHAVYFKQVGYGLMVRMALLEMVLS